MSKYIYAKLALKVTGVAAGWGNVTISQPCALRNNPERKGALGLDVKP